MAETCGTALASAIGSVLGVAVVSDEEVCDPEGVARPGRLYSPPSTARCLSTAVGVFIMAALVVSGGSGGGGGDLDGVGGPRGLCSASITLGCSPTTKCRKACDLSRSLDFELSIVDIETTELSLFVSRNSATNLSSLSSTLD